MFAYGARTAGCLKIKFADSKGSTFGRTPQRAKLFIVQALIGRAREPFCKRKGSRKLIAGRNYPSKIIRWMIFEQAEPAPISPTAQRRVVKRKTEDKKKS